MLEGMCVCTKLKGVLGVVRAWPCALDQSVTLEAGLGPALIGCLPCEGLWPVLIVSLPSGAVCWLCLIGFWPAVTDCLSFPPCGLGLFALFGFLAGGFEPLVGFFSGRSCLVLIGCLSEIAGFSSWLDWPGTLKTKPSRVVIGPSPVLVGSVLRSTERCCASGFKGVEASVTCEAVATAEADL